MSKQILRRINFRDFGVVQKLSVAPDDIPTLVNGDVLAEWQAGDKEPYYKLQKIEYPIKANGINYTETFFESFLKKLSERPIPGSKNGHSIFWGERPATDFILVGGMLEKNADGTGAVYFKNYIPPVGEGGSNEIFIRENKSDMVHYSLVTYPREEKVSNADGSTSYFAVESLFGERNDAVEYGTGAMKQVTNKGEVLTEDDEIGDEAMNKEELVKAVNALLVSGEVTLKDLGQTAAIDAIKLKNSLADIGVDDPVKEINTLREQVKKDVEAVRNARLTELFGAAGDKNLIRAYVEGRTENKTGEDFEKVLNGIKDDPIAKALVGEAADPNSDANEIGKVENKKETKTDEPVVVDY